MKKLFLLLPLLLAASAHAQPNGITGLEQRASAPIINYDTFDYPNGTLIDGQTTADGNSVWSEGAHTAVVQNGELTNTGNSYSSFGYTTTPGGTPQPVPSFGGTFKYKINPGNGVSTVLIADKDGLLQKFIHLELGVYTWTLTVADAPTYPFATYISSDAYLRPLTVGVQYGASMDIDPVGCKVTINLPDGQSKTFTHPAVCDINPKFPRYQLGASTTPGTAVWTSVWAGPSKAKTFAALGQAADQLDLSNLLSTFNVVQNRKTVPVSGTFLIATFTPGSPQFDNTLTIKMRAGLNSAVLNGVASDNQDVRIHTVSQACCVTLGSTNVLNSNPQQGAGMGISLTGLVNAVITSGVVSIFYTPTVGGPNAGYANGVRLNYTVEAEGDPGGRLVAQ